MRAANEDKLTKPVSVDADFFQKIESLYSLSVAQKANDLSRSLGMSPGDVEAIIRGTDFAGSGNVEERLKAQILRESSLDINIKFEGKRKFGVSKIQDAISILNEEGGQVSEFRIEYGSVIDQYWNIDLDNKYSQNSYEVRGDRVYVDLITGRIVQLLTESEPNYSILHRSWFPTFFRITFSLSISVLYVYIVVRFKSHWAVDYKNLLPLVGFPFFASLTFLADPLVKRVERTYPFCQFEFGQQKKRRDAGRSLTIAIICSVVIPIILSIFGF